MSLHHLHNWARSLTDHSIHSRPLDAETAKQWMSHTVDSHLTKWANQVRNHKIKEIELEQEWCLVFDLWCSLWTNLLQTKFVCNALSNHNLQLARKCTIQNFLKQTFGFVNNTICNHSNDYGESKNMTQYEKLLNDHVMA